MFFSSDPAGRKLINIAAQDNQYISAIQFLTTDGKLIGTLSPNQQTANEALSLSVNVASMKQDKVVVAVVDYAGNARAYELELGLGGDRRRRRARSGAQWLLRLQLDEQHLGAL